MINLMASFTAEPMQPMLQWLAELAGLEGPVVLAPYGQVFQELLDPSSQSGRMSKGATVVLVRAEDFSRDLADDADRGGRTAALLQEFAAAMKGYALRAKGPVLWALLPASTSGAAALAAADEESWTASLQDVANLHRLDPAQWQAVVDLADAADEASDRLGHIPYTDVGFAGLALAVTRRLHQLLVTSHKVLVLDCDNTIWGGVVGEDGPQGVQLTPSYLAVQRFAVEAQQRGVLVCLASKNVAADVDELFVQRPDMVLRPEQIVAQRVNWLPKPQNISSLAAELNLGLDSFVFLDDNPVEIGQMHEALPQVVSLLLPPPEQIPAFLDHLWTFDKAGVTDEDARRTEMYRENQARQQLESSATDIGAFIASLALDVDLNAPDEAEWPRVSQLSLRTNQFNFTTRRRSEPEMREFHAAPGCTLTRVRVRDRFGDYGLVGLMLSRTQGQHLQVDTFLLSCRVLGRGVEHAMLRNLGEEAQRRGLAAVELLFTPTAKNEPAKAFADSVAATWRTDAGYLIPTEAALAVQHRPGEDPEAVMAAARSDGAPKAHASAASSALLGRSQRYSRLAQELTDGAAALAAWRLSQARSRNLATVAEAPADATERALLDIWQTLFNATDLGVSDDFAQLGGTSLMAARLFAEVERRLGCRLRLTTILEAPTIRLLAKRVQEASQGVQDPASGSQMVRLHAGRSATLFMVHDGDGETLLYRNLAQRLPEDVGLVGIEPLALHGVPMAHVDIAAMAASYVDQVRAVQPRGPYHLGGMCAGGLIAYEMAQQLAALGEPVAQVLMLDAATPQASKRKGRLNAERFERLRLLREEADARFGRSPLKHVYLFQRWLGKAYNAAAWALGSRVRKAWAGWRFELLQKVLGQGRTWPQWLKPLSVRQIYNAAEARYQPAPSQCKPALLLVRATQGAGSDIPYQEVYEDASLGWAAVAPNVAVVDVPGGHASMLQEPWVDALAEVVRSRWPSAPAQQPGVAARQAEHTA